jgi:hypothetical protein
MKQSVPVVLPLVIVAGLAGQAEAYRKRPPPAPPAPAVDVGAELGAAIRGKNAARVTKLLGDSVQNYGIWFADAACAKQFGTPGVVTSKDVPAFARCLTQLKLLAQTRQPGSADSALLTYDPGIELEVSHSGGRVRWIGFQYQTAGDRGRPTLTAQAFEALRKAGKTNLDDTVSARLDPVLERGKVASVSSWVKICIDDQGTVDHVNVRQSDAPSGEASKVSSAFEFALRSWRFKPFELRKKAIPVCSMALLTYPASRAPLVETLPPALQPTFSLTKGAAADGDDDDEEEGDDEEGVEGGVAGGTPSGPPAGSPQSIPPTMLESNRLTGNKNIQPDAATQAAIAKSGKDTVVGSHKLCIDDQGAVSAVNLLKSTGFSDYDTKLAREMKKWTYKPYTINGKAAPVCTAVTFIYTLPKTP